MINISKVTGFLFYIFTVIVILIVPRVGHGAEPVNIGVMHWENFTYAEMMRNSYEMALEDINRNGGIKGRPLKLVYADDKGTREAGEKAVRKLINESGALILVGGYASSNTIYTAGIANELDIPFVISTAADDRITQRKWKNIYRINPPAKEYARGVEELMLKKIKPKSISIIYENSPYGTGGALQMMWFCREHNIEVRKIIPYHKERTGPDYFHKLVAPLKENPPDVIYMVSYLQDAVSIVKKINKLNIYSLLVGSAGGFTSPKFIAMAGPAADALLTATLWTPNLPYSGAQEYYEKYVRMFGTEPDYHGAEAYSVLLVASDALRRAKSMGSVDIRAALDKTNMKTAFGPVNFKAYGKFERQNSLPTMVLQVINNKFESVWPGEIATSKFISHQDSRKKAGN
jgi:branched-chain amino acid transport system substrate-binding protein